MISPKADLTERKLPLLFPENEEVLETEQALQDLRKKWLDILAENLYGFSPAAPEAIHGEIISESSEAYAWKVTVKSVVLSFDTPKGTFSFPVKFYLPNNVEKPPMIIHIAFRPVPDHYIPVEEITDQGFALAVFLYQDIIKDSLDSNFNQGLGACYYEDNHADNSWGKIGMWAFAASRVLDYVLAEKLADERFISVAGHSRLGKTALWCAAQDERFYCAFSNDSGTLGAALYKGGTGEKFSNFVDYGSSDWVCKNALGMTETGDELPYDQHFLLAAIAPRRVYISSAELDSHADPHSEFLSCLAASPAWEKRGFKGLVSEDCYPEAPACLHEGKIGYHIRKYHHFLSREDWNAFCGYLKESIQKES